MDTEKSMVGKKVVILFGNLEMGGAERQGLLVARYLKELCGAVVEVWGLGPLRGPVADQCEAWGIHWRAVPLHWGLKRRFSHLLRLLFTLRSASPDLLMPYTRVPNLACGLLWRLSGCKTMLWNQADEGLLLQHSLLHRYAISQVPHFIVNSKAAEILLTRTFGVQPSRIRFIKNGVTTGHAHVDRRQWRMMLGADEGQLVATMLANLTSYKDHTTLISAWSRVVSYFAKTTQQQPLLVLAGRFEDTAQALQDQIQEAGLRDSVRLIGYTDDSFGLLQASDLCVFSSRSECYPNAILEAMQAGLPVAASDIAGIRDTVGSDGSPWLAAPGDAETLAKCIIDLAADHSLRLQLGKLMQKRVQSEFSERAMCQQVGEVIFHVLNSDSVAGQPGPTGR